MASFLTQLFTKISFILPIDGNKPQKMYFSHSANKPLNVFDGKKLFLFVPRRILYQIKIYWEEIWLKCLPRMATGHITARSSLIIWLFCSVETGTGSFSTVGTSGSAGQSVALLHMEPK